MPTRGLALTKEALRLSFHNTLESRLLNEDGMQNQAAHTRDFKEGVAAFLEKRQPVLKKNS